ncbi:STAS domain-containing protein [Streptomyces sp. NPDC059862]|uniref:STAS domain-containing protein n=1 Tax=unclassified Streptomyces TaxID=2593676 RepID=UPI0036437A5D
MPPPYKTDRLASTRAWREARDPLTGGTTVVELRGEIGILTAPPRAAHLDVLTAGPCPDLVLDLRSVSFIDCRGPGLPMTLSARRLGPAP